MDAIVGRLRQVGFSLYQARLSAALLRHGRRTETSSRVSRAFCHDLVLQRAKIDIGFDDWDRWWPADPELRGQILGRALGRNADARAAAPAA